MMVGRPVLFRLEKPEVEIGEPVLRLEGLTGGRLRGCRSTCGRGRSSASPGSRATGSATSRTSSWVCDPLDAGRILLDGEDLASRSTAEIRNAGVGFVPEDRHEQGLVLGMTLWENLVLGRQDDPPFVKYGVLSLRRIKDLARKLVRLFDVRARSIDVTAGAPVRRNQQKLILARELETDPKLLLAAQPTRGLDVGAIEFVWSQILEQKAAGRGHVARSPPSSTRSTRCPTGS